MAARVWTGLAAALLYIGLALASGLDRAVPDRPDLARWIPQSLQAQSLTAEARRYVAVGIPASALGPARLAVARDPANPATAAVLGAALLAVRRPAEAGAAFRIAALGGWRDVLTQVYWMQAALGVGDTKAAVVRFDALARQYPGAPAVAAAAGLLEASPEGRTALARQLAGGANWANSYAAFESSAPPERMHNRAEVLIATAAFGRVLGCAAVAPAVGALAESDALTAARLWRAHCPEARGEDTPSDGAMIRQGAPRVPFDWDYPGHGDIESGVVAERGRGFVRSFRSTSAAPLPVAAQLVPLAPGAWRVSWRGTGPEGATLSCRRDVPAPSEWPVRSDNADQSRSRVFAVGNDCRAQWLQLWIAPGPGEARFTAVRVEAVR